MALFKLDFYPEIRKARGLVWLQLNMLLAAVIVKVDVEHCGNIGIPLYMLNGKQNITQINSQNKVVIRRRKDFGERTYCPLWALINLKMVLQRTGYPLSKVFLLAINEKDLLRNVFGPSDFLCKSLLKPSAWNRSWQRQYKEYVETWGQA